jgi:hypothetical protein
MLNIVDQMWGGVRQSEKRSIRPKCALETQTLLLALKILELLVAWSRLTPAYDAISTVIGLACSLVGSVRGHCAV